MKRFKYSIVTAALLALVVFTVDVKAQQAVNDLQNGVAQAKQELGIDADTWAVARYMQQNLPAETKQKILDQYGSFPMGQPMSPRMQNGKGMRGQGQRSGMAMGMNGGRGNGQRMVMALGLTTEQWQKAMPIQQEFRQKRLEIMNKKLTMSQHQVEMLKLVNERNQQLKGILTEEQMQKLQDMQTKNRVQMMTRRNNMQQGLNLTGEQLEQMHQVNMEFRSTMQQKMTPGNPQANMQARRDMWKQHLQKMREVLNEQQLETWQLHHAIMMEQGGGMGMRAPRGNRW